MRVTEAKQDHEPKSMRKSGFLLIGVRRRRRRSQMMSAMTANATILPQSTPVITVIDVRGREDKDDDDEEVDALGDADVLVIELLDDDV